MQLSPTGTPVCMSCGTIAIGEVANQGSRATYQRGSMFLAAGSVGFGAYGFIRNLATGTETPEASLSFGVLLLCAGLAGGAVFGILGFVLRPKKTMAPRF